MLVLGYIDCNKSSYGEDWKARAKKYEWVKGGKSQGKNIQDESNSNQGLSSFKIIVEIILERGMSHVSSLKIPQLKNFQFYHLFYIK